MNTPSNTLHASEPQDRTLLLVTTRTGPQTEVLACWQRDDQGTVDGNGKWWLIAGHAAPSVDSASQDGLAGPYQWVEVLGDNPSSTLVQELFLPEENQAAYNRGFLDGAMAAQRQLVGGAA